MPKGKSNNAPLIAALRVKSDALAEEIASIDADIQKRMDARAVRIDDKAQVDALIARYSGGKKRVQKAPPAARGFVKPIAVHAPQSGPYFGLAIPSASVKCLEITGERMTSRAIWSALEAAGVTTTAADPVGRVHWELRKRAEKIGDVTLIGGGKWALTKSVTDEEKEEIRRNMNGQPGRDKELHSAKVKAGMQNLKDRGVRIGAPVKMDAETVAELRKLILAGWTASAASKKVGISAGTFFNYRRKGLLGEDLKTPRGRALNGKRLKRRAGQGIASPETPDLLTQTNGSVRH